MRQVRRLQAAVLALASLVLIVLLVVVVRFFLHPIAGLALLAASVLALALLRWARRRVPRRTILELDLDRAVVERTPTEPIGRALSRGALVLRDVVDALDRAAADDRVVALIARVGNGTIGLAQAQELRDAVKRFSAAGKRAIAFAETFGESDAATVQYYLAAAFDEIHLQPNGELNSVGLIARRPFLKHVFELLQITPDFDHRREYKAAKYLLTEDHYVEPDREATMALMASQLDQIIEGIVGDRGLDASQVRDMIDRSPLLPEAAAEGGLVDGLSYRDEVYEAVVGDRDHLLFLERYLKRAGRPHRRGPSVALVYGVGTILRGEPRFDPLTQGSSMGSDVVAEAFRKAVDQRRVKAIIFRVDSRGGSAVASDVVRRETLRAREAGKPVIVTMGDVAGSGGYWISSAAHRVLAQPGTITGSIGVVFGKLVTRQAWRRAGVSWDELHLGRNATFMSPDYPFTDSEWEYVDSYLDGVYEDFKSRVAEDRSLEIDRVEEIAKGRIWSGEEAHRLGLVDELGGMSRALELAKELAEIPEDQQVKVVVYPKERTLRLPERRESSEAARLVDSLADTIESLTSLANGFAHRGVVQMPDHGLGTRR